MSKVEDLYPLTPLQQGMLYHTLRTPGRGIYVERLSWVLRGRLDVGAFRRAWQTVVARCQILRTEMVWEDLDEPLQAVRSEVALPWIEHDWSELSPDEQEQRLEAFLDADLRRDFELTEAPLMRLALLRLSRDRYRFVFCHHHLLLDGWARVLVLREVFELYRAFVQGRELELEPSRPFRDYVAWLKRQDPRRAEVFWRRTLAGFRSPTPIDFLRTSGAGGSPESVDPTRSCGRRLTAAASARLRERMQRQQLTLNTLCQGAWALLLALASGERDVVFGAVASGRPPGLAGVEEMVGPLINTQPVRVSIEPDLPVSSWLRKLQAEQAQMRRFEHSPLIEVQGWSDLPRGQALFETLLVLENHPTGIASAHDGAGAVGAAALEVVDRRYDSKTHYPLTLVVEPGERLAWQLRYDGDRLDATAVDRLARRFGRALEGLAEAGARPLGDVELSSPAERHQLRVEWNDTGGAPTRPLPLHARVAARAAGVPEAVAVVCGDARLSYGELARRASRVAGALARRGAGPEQVVALLVERTPELVVAILAILETGAAYLPLDPAYPDQRLSYLLADSGARLVLTQQRLAGRFPDSGLTAVELETAMAEAGGDIVQAPPPDAEQLAYVLYTSGSTGRPKGVAIEHRSAAALLDWARGAFGPSELRGVLASTSVCFDLSVFELFLPLSEGGSVILADDLLALGELPAAAELSLVNTVPSVLDELLKTMALPASVTTVNLAGEPIPGRLVEALLGRRAPGRAYNLYGPSEATTYSTFARIEPAADRPPIGRPITGTTAHVLDPRLHPVPIAVRGGLYLGGAGLARGYLGRPAATAERFVPDPLGARPGSRLYATGDVVLWRPDGQLEFLGRADHQVKLRGFRIEPGEIEASLARHPEVEAAAVAVRDDEAGDRQLVAYVVAGPSVRRPDDAAAADRLRGYLAERLPAHLVPARLVFLEALPTTLTGKLDRLALPAPGRRRPPRSAIAPRNELERELSAIWREVLGIEDVGVEDRFFDLGAHSLHVVRAYGKLRERFGSRLALTDLFKHPSISALARHLAVTEPVPQLSRGEERGRVRRAARADSRARVAVVGMVGRFPGAADVGGFWHNLCSGVSSILRHSDDELQARGVPAALLDSPGYVKAGAVLDGIELFDAAFFGYSPLEAEMLDPQHRLFLEAAWEALEDAGCDPARLGGAVGVFAGASLNRYWGHLLANPGRLAGLETRALLDNDKDFLTTRVSYQLGLTGPSLAVQTACSTSLVAVHLACRSLLEGECDLALAGGVSIDPRQGQGYRAAEGGLLSPDGRCRAFDADARGTVPGNGLGIVVLRRLEDAVADGDRVRAVILGSAINNDGSTKVGFTAPSVEGQAAVIREALAVAEVEPATVGYVEAHGTGTELGDPIEVAALREAFAGREPGAGPCALGSVKTNVGHLDAAAGVAGLIKTVLALEHRRLPPSLGFERPNPRAGLGDGPFRVQTRLADWPSDGHPRRAGVSSFGLGGTNAHVVLEEAPPPEVSGPSRPWQLLVLSARTPTALEAAAERLGRHLEEHAEQPLADVAHTLRCRRIVPPHRRVVIAGGREEAIAALARRDPERAYDGARSPSEVPVAFLFPGQGSQHAGMGRELYRDEAEFRRSVDRCAELLAPRLGRDLREVLGFGTRAPAGSAEELRQTAVAQPAIFVVEYALAQLWASWGIRPAAMLGHSVGEYTAACLAGVFTLSEALELVASRGRLIQRLPAGAMLAVPLSEARLEPFLGGGLSLAAVNLPESCVVSGTVDAVAELEHRLQREGLVCRRLVTSHAFHSEMMEEVLDAFAEKVRRVELKPPRSPYVSNLTGTWIEAEEATDPDYWRRHLRGTVRFADGVSTLFEPGELVALEVGPGTALSELARRHPAVGRERIVLSSLPHPRRPIPEQRALLTALGRLWLGGVEVWWPGFQGEERRSKVALPCYPFERRRYWLEAEGRRLDAPATRRARIADWFYVPSWKLSAPLARPAAEEPARPPSWCLVLGDGGGLGAALAEQLSREGLRVVTVTAGAGSGALSGEVATIDPSSRDDYDVLIRRLSEAGRWPRTIFHLWDVDGAAASTDAIDSLQAGLERSFFSPLWLVQALARHGPGREVDLVVASTGLYAVDPGDVPRIAAAPIAGLCRVVPQEHPDVSCRVVDLGVSPLPRREWAREAARCLAAELSVRASEIEVAYRGGLRWVRSFTELPLEPGDEPAPVLRERGVYLIFGGLGRIGLACAELLSREVKARLVLVSRSPFPPRDRWQAWLESHPEADPTSEKIRRLAALEEAGSEVRTCCADVADEDQVLAAMDLAERSFEALDGVVHAAGKADPQAFRLLGETGRREAGEHFRAKLYGARVLGSVLDGRELDFCLLCSSLSSTLGGLGFGAYAAANACLDALAQARHLAGDRRFISLDWEGWRGSQAGSEPAVGFGARQAALALSPQQGMEVFRRALWMVGCPQLVISTGDLHQRCAQWLVETRGASGEIALDADAPSELAERPVLETPYTAPRGEVEKTIAALWQRYLGIGRIGADDNLFELGADSLLATRLLGALRRGFGVSLSLRGLFEQPTVAGQAAVVTELRSAPQTPIPEAPLVREEPDMAGQLDDLARLSDEEVETLLEAKGGSSR